MRSYVSLCLMCYVLFLLLPLPFIADKPSAPPPTAETTVTTKPTATTAAPPAETEEFRVLDAAADVVYTFGKRDFLIYTVAAEMPASYPTEALKAQAVASYTYYTYQKNRELDGLHGAHFADPPSSFPASYTAESLKERWGKNYETYLKKIADAVDAVDGEMVRFEGEPIFAAYHSCNGGRTESSKIVWGTEYRYLQSVNSSGDTLSPHASSAVTVSDKAFAAAFPDLKLEGDAGKWITGKPTVSDAGTVTGITIGGKTFSGREVRTALSLKSACFTVKHDKDGFTFTVSGYGHGVGLSQYGAKVLADQGFTYKEILQHYYTDTEIAKRRRPLAGSFFTKIISLNVLFSHNSFNGGAVRLHSDEVNDKENGRNDTENNGENEHADMAAAVVGKGKIGVYGIYVLRKFFGGFLADNSERDEHPAEDDSIHKAHSHGKSAAKTLTADRNSHSDEEKKHKQCRIYDSHNDKHLGCDVPRFQLPTKQAVSVVQKLALFPHIGFVVGLGSVDPVFYRCTATDAKSGTLFYFFSTLNTITHTCLPPLKFITVS